MRIRPNNLLLLCMMALMAILTTSCSKHKIAKKDAIELGATSMGTKALVTDEGSFVNLSYTGNKGFGVYGYKKVDNPTGNSTTNTLLFNNIEVKPNENVRETTWYYSPLRYWDKNPNASYQFIAYWPLLPEFGDNLGANETYVSEANKVLTINRIPNWQPTATGTDYLLAEPRIGQHVSTTGDPLFGDGKVKFTFSHLLAKIEVRAYYVGARQNVYVNVSQLTLQSPDENNNIVLSSGGTVDVSHDFSQSGNTNQYGTITSGASKDLMSQPVDLPQTTWFNEAQGGSPTNFQTLCSWLTVPCNLWNGLDLSVNYTVASTSLTGKATGGLTLDNGQTLPGHSYVITLKITAYSGIEIESIQVKNWIEGTESNQNVYNW